MSPIDAAKATATHVVKAPSSELFVHGAIVIVVVICATVLGLHGSLDSGDELAVFTAAITGTAAVAGARSSNRSVRSGESGIPNGSD